MPITSIISLNQIIDWFQNFQENHYFLKDFGFGEPYDIGTSRQMTFPYMWVTMNEDSNIATGSNVKSAIPDISFSVMFMDKINNQENYLDTNGFPSDNSQEILSDTLQCLQDLITEIQQNWGQYGVLISQDVSFYPAVDETQDKATGVVGRFVLRTRQVNCVIPEAPSTIVVQPNQATYATLLTCETLVDCPIFRTYAYTGGTYNSGTTVLTLTSLNGNQISVSGITGGGGGGSGTSGSSGTSGTSGTSGSDGSSGTSGVSGTNGSSGTSGTSGINGTSGTSGINGTSGTSGDNGTSGTSGSSGTSGTSGTSPIERTTINYYVDDDIELDASLYIISTCNFNATNTNSLDIINLQDGDEVNCFLVNNASGNKIINLLYNGSASINFTSPNSSNTTSINMNPASRSLITVYNSDGIIFGTINRGN
jgi:hypothetical protein